MKEDMEDIEKYDLDALIGIDPTYPLSSLEIGPYLRKRYDYNSACHDCKNGVIVANLGSGFAEYDVPCPECSSKTQRPREHRIGDKVEKTGGDYKFKGTIVSIFKKLSGAIRIVVENEDGIIHIFNPQQLRETCQENGETQK